MTKEGIGYTGQSGTIGSVEFAVQWDVDQAGLADLGLGNGQSQRCGVESSTCGQEQKLQEWSSGLEEDELRAGEAPGRNLQMSTFKGRVKGDGNWQTQESKEKKWY